MKFRLLNRNYWSDYDTWVAKKKGYKVEIETAYRKGHEDIGRFLYRIVSPTGDSKTSLKDNKYFDSLEEACQYVETWIDEQK